MFSWAVGAASPPGPLQAVQGRCHVGTATGPRGAELRPAYAVGAAALTLSP